MNAVVLQTVWLPTVKNESTGLVCDAQWGMNYIHGYTHAGVINSKVGCTKFANFTNLDGFCNRMVWFV